MKQFILITVALTLLVACVQVPYTRIEGDLNKGTFVVKAPKDGELEGLDITRGTNGTVTVKVKKHSVRMNPDVVKQTAEGQAALIQASLQGAADLASKVAEGAAKGASPVKK